MSARRTTPERVNEEVRVTVVNDRSSFYGMRGAIGERRCQNSAAGERPSATRFVVFDDLPQSRMGYVPFFVGELRFEEGQ